ncbi:hypothetical protein [Acidisphaera sp. L21]|uniref:hypothetical protein n=1 Tax=Acidisphaera sp. L21 TaxID=1641851 RepID=UPI00131DC80F|nr:hypothetical protein [Acidisphaera sp. L21]
MTETEFIARLKEHGLVIPETEVPALQAFVEDLERAAEFVRATERSYAEEPSNVFRLPS